MIIASSKRDQFKMSKKSKNEVIINMNHYNKKFLENNNMLLRLFNKKKIMFQEFIKVEACNLN